MLFRFILIMPAATPAKSKARFRMAFCTFLMGILGTAQAQPPEDKILGPYLHSVPATLNNYAISHWLEQKQDPQTALILLDRALRITPNQTELRQNRDKLIDVINKGTSIPLPVRAPQKSTAPSSVETLNQSSNTLNPKSKNGEPIENEAGRPTSQTEASAHPQPALVLPERWDEIPEPAKPEPAKSAQ